MKKMLIALTLAMSAASPLMAATELLTNGNFETGSFTGWTVSNASGGTGSFYIDTPGTTSPVSGQSTPANANGGNWYAVTDQGGPGAHALTQAFTVAANTTALSLSFQLLMQNSAGATYNTRV